MWNQHERDSFLDQGYLHVQGVLSADQLGPIREAFDAIRERHGRCNQHVLLQYPLFIDLIQHPAILGRQAAIFGRQTQLLQYDFLRQGPDSTFPDRQWHRDFAFPGDHPLAINTILYLDDMTDERGPTYVAPGTHRGVAMPPTGDARGQPLPGELAVYADAGDAVFINSAIWHSGSRNRTQGERRAIYLYYGYWWLKRYEADRQLPTQALEQADDARLRLLGVRMPEPDLHQYQPGLTFDVSPSSA